MFFRYLHICFLFILFLPFSGQSQGFDSLQWMNDHLDHGFDALSKGSLDKSSGIGLKVMQYGQKNNNPQLYAQSCLLLAEVALRTKNWNEGVKYAARAMEKVKEVDPFLWCNVGVTLVDIYYKYGVDDKAVGLSQKIFSLSKLTKDQELRLLDTWCLALFSLDKTKDAEALLDRYFLNKQADFIKNPLPYLELFELWLDAKSKNHKFNEAYNQLIGLLAIIDSEVKSEKHFSLLNKAGELSIELKDYNKAIAYFNEAKTISEKRWPNQENYLLINLARAYFWSGNYQRAYDLAEKSYDEAEKGNYDFQKAISAAFISRLQVSVNAISSAVDWANLALRLAEDINDLPLQFQVSILLSELFSLNNEFERSAKFKNKAEKINEKILLGQESEKLRKANLSIEISDSELEAIIELQSFEKQRLLLNDKLIKIQMESQIQEERFKSELQVVSAEVEKERVLNRLQKVEADKLNQDQLYKISELENKRKSSLLSISELKIQKQDIENKNLSLKLKNDNLAAQDELNKREIEYRKKQSLLGVIFTGVVLFVLVIIVFFLRKTRSQNKTIEKNNQEIQLINRELGEKNDEIVSGIQYASKFQEMVYPKESDLQGYFQDGFIIHRPLEMVSGDLPFVFCINDQVFVAAVDCIGHGVSASMLSIMTYFGLTDIIRSKPDNDCASILTALHERMVKRLSQSENKNYLVSVDLSIINVHLKTKQLQFSGANLPLIQVRRNEVTMFKGGHISIGENVSTERLKFENFDLQCEAGDELYLFSDGFYHQFGGVDGKQKLSKKRIMKKLEEVGVTEFRERKFQLNELFDNWKSEEMQTDDLVILGIKI